MRMRVCKGEDGEMVTVCVCARLPMRARVCVVARWRDVEYLHWAPACIASLHIARGSQLMSRNDARVHRRRHDLPSSNSKARTAARGRRYTCPPKDSRRQTFAGSRRRCFRRSGGSPQSCLSRCTCRCTMEEPVRNSGKSAACPRYFASFAVSWPVAQADRILQF